MHNCTCRMPHYPHQAYPQHTGLVGLVGGIINLTTSSLFGGARIVRTLVEGSVWGAEHPPHYGSCGCCQQHCCHVHHLHCIPETHDGCGCC